MLLCAAGEESTREDTLTEKLPFPGLATSLCSEALSMRDGSDSLVEPGLYVVNRKMGALRQDRGRRQGHGRQLLRGRRGMNGGSMVDVIVIVLLVRLGTYDAHRWRQLRSRNIDISHRPGHPWCPLSGCHCDLLPRTPHRTQCGPTRWFCDSDTPGTAG